MSWLSDAILYEIYPQSFADPTATGSATSAVCSTTSTTSSRWG